MKRDITAQGKSFKTDRDLYSLCEEKFTKNEAHNKRTFHFIEQKDVVRQRPERCVTKTVPGTMKIQSVKRCGVSGVIKSRNLTCFCESCQCERESQAPCSNNEYIDAWEVKKLRLEIHAHVNEADTMVEVVDANEIMEMVEQYILREEFTVEGNM